MQCSLGRRSPIIISPDPVLDRERHHDLHFELLNTIVHYCTWSLWPYLLGELAVTGFAEQVHSAILGRMSAMRCFAAGQASQLSGRRRYGVWVEIGLCLQRARSICGSQKPWGNPVNPSITVLQKPVQPRSNLHRVGRVRPTSGFPASLHIRGLRRWRIDLPTAGIRPQA